MSTETKMRKLLLFAILFVTGSAWAADYGPADGEVSQNVSKTQSYMSQAVYQSSTTCAGSTLQSVWISSPFAASLYAIDITSAGTGNAFFQVFDGEGSTSNARRVSQYVDASTERTVWYNVSFSSWLGVFNQSLGGTPPACLDIIYRIR